jgi:hypothetical protein
MSALLQPCASELHENLPYLRHPCDTVSVVRRDLRRSFQVDAIEGLIDVAGLIVGMLLFVVVVVPLGAIGKLRRAY